MSLQDQRVLSLSFLTDHTFVLRTTRPSQQVVAGQCFSVGVSDLGINREYSIYSGEDDDYLEFLIRCIPDGAVSSRLSKVSVNEVVQIGGPYGSFTIQDRVETDDFVFISSGTGIAPFISYVRSYPNLRYTLFQGVRMESEDYGSQFLDPERYNLAVSAGSATRSPQRVTQLLLESTNPNASSYYICGNRNMIVDAVQILREKSVSGGQIFMETFF